MALPPPDDSVLPVDAQEEPDVIEHGELPILERVYPVFRQPGIEFTSARILLEYYARFHFIEYGPNGNAL